MRSRGVGAVLALGLVASGTMVGCLSGDDNSNPSPGADASVPLADSGPIPQHDAGHDATVPDAGSDVTQPPADSGTDTTPPQDTGPGTALIRVAWFLSNGGLPRQVPTVKGRAARRTAAAPLPGTYDVCVAPHGTGAWQGPLLAAAGGLQQFDVTTYQTVIAGQYDVRIVQAPDNDSGTTTCDDVPPFTAADGGDAGTPWDITSLPPIPAGAALTITVNDPADPATAIADVSTFVDEVTPGAKVQARLINVTEIDGDFAFGSGGGVAFLPWFQVATGVALDPSGDSHGYKAIDPITIDTSLWETGSEVLDTDSMTLAAGDVITAFATGAFGEGRSPVLVVCRDGKANPEVPLKGDCVVSTSTTVADNGLVRVADFIADDPGPVDFCIKYKQQAAYGTPVTLAGGSDAGIGGLGSVSPYVTVHSGFDYDLRLVAAGSATCATGLVTDGAFTLPAGTGFYDARATVAAVGYVTPPDGGTIATLHHAAAAAGDAGSDAAVDAGPTSTPGLTTLALTYLTFLDADGNGTTPALRFINADAKDAKPMSLDNGNWSILNVPYGAMGTPAGADARGYVVEPQGSGFPSLNGGNQFNVSLNAGDYDSVFVIPDPQGTAPGIIVYCHDAPFTGDCTMERPAAL